MQTRMLFPAGLASANPATLPASSVSLEITTADNASLKGLLIPAGSSLDTKPLHILGFGGNAWNASQTASFLHALFPDRNVVVFYYRGYAPSTGDPSAKNLLSDSLLIHDYLRQELGAERVISVGLSIGSGVAAYLASRRPLSGLILVSPFDSLTNLASSHYPWLPVKWLLRHQMNPAEALSGNLIPTAIIAAERDTIVPPSRTDALRKAIPNLVLDRTIPGAGHNDLYDRPEFRSAIVNAMELIETQIKNP
jgi:uncharacterized protein